MSVRAFEPLFNHALTAKLSVRPVRQQITQPGLEADSRACSTPRPVASIL
jgi:hypothetical protein